MRLPEANHDFRHIADVAGAGVRSAVLTPFQRWFDWRSPPSLAFAATVALAFLCSYWEGAIHFSRGGGAWCLVLGATYAFFGTIDYGFFRQQLSRWARGAYLCLMGALLFGVLHFSRLSGEMVLCVFPLVAATLALLPAVAASLGIAGIYAMILILERQFYGAEASIRWSISMLPSFGFVVIFTRIALRAVEARRHAEALAVEVERLAVIQERNRLAREIHDSLGHFLTTIHVQLEAARTIHAADPARALAAVAQAQDLARDALVEVRRSVGALQADQAPLPARLRDLALTTDGWGAAVSLEILGETRALALEAEHALFRTAQEGLTNVRKHAGARTARVILDYRDPARVQLDVIDDGAGAAGAPAGCGLGGLRERVAALGGRVAAGDAPGGGFRLQAEVPA
jgi:signal transduction histidine kinase